MTVVQKNDLRTITQRIIESYRPEKIVLFGSHAEGRSRFDSDLDLLIIKNTRLPRYKRISSIYHSLRGVKRDIPVDPLVLSQQEIADRLSIGDPFIAGILRRGKVVYDRSSSRQEKIS